MYAKQHPHPFNIADCIKAKVNRLDKEKIREQRREERTQDELWEELRRRHKLIMSEPNGIVRETMIHELLDNL